MKVIIDECVPSIVKRQLSDRDIVSVQEMGWAGIKNGKLLRLVAESFDVFITSDQNLRYQQNLTLIDLSIVVLPSNQVPIVRLLISEIDSALDVVRTGSLVEIPLP